MTDTQPRWECLAAQFINLVLILGVGRAYLFLSDRLAAGQWAGAILIFAAVAAIIRLQRVDVMAVHETLSSERVLKLSS